ncbi:hypothetical protein B0H15DRAFT_971676 [Mycena belliarum]|uniref:F-box domain-containing protein n=1 Tax=Mycena belliarum TaxID=1033014 RepID=A0AAD6U8L5_9AGAR|nr:hypothetical protein B0H15DRAFT_971676 [Mycena belliae]
MPQLCWKCGTSSETIPTLSPPRASPTNFSHLLDSNRVPLDEESLAIRRLVTTGQNGLRTLDAHIDSLQKSLSKLVRRRGAMEEYVRKHKSILSPVRRLPPELLCTIFLMTPPFIRRLKAKTVNQPPWRLGHVCRAWRQAALSLPLLWSSIHIADHPWTLPLRDVYPDAMLETQLQRSATQPLDITIESEGDLRLAGPLHLDSARWRTLSIRVVGLDSVDDLLSAAEGHLPLLETLDVIDAHVNSTQMPSTIFATAPNLRHVLLTNCRLQQHSPPLVIPWHQITHYRGRYPAQRQFDILRAAPALVQCGLCFVGPARLPGDQIVTVPALRRLHVRDDVFLNHLTAPQLEALFVEDFLTGAILPLIRRSACRLTKLVLLHCTVAAVPPLIQHLPSLAELHIRTYSPLGQTLQPLFYAMTLGPGRPAVCPNLTSFSFGLGGGINSSTGAVAPFIAMLQSRLDARLAFVRLYSETPLPKELARGIGVLADAGLDIAFLDWREAEKLIEGRRF